LGLRGGQPAARGFYGRERGRPRRIVSCAPLEHCLAAAFSTNRRKPDDTQGDQQPANQRWLGNGPALWTAARHQIPVTIVVASNAEYGVVKEFAGWEKTFGVPGLDIPGLDIVATAASYGVDAHEAHSTDDVSKLVEAGIADRDRPTLINARTTPVNS